MKPWKWVTGGLVGLVIVAAAVDASNDPPKEAAPAEPTVQVAAVATATARPKANYAQHRTQLATALTSVLQQYRGRNVEGIRQMKALFQDRANAALASIEGDVSVDANKLHSAVVNAREAFAVDDAAHIERIRNDLLN